jgi:hypothetical protein
MDDNVIINKHSIEIKNKPAPHRRKQTALTDKAPFMTIYYK